MLKLIHEGKLLEFENGPALIKRLRLEHLDPADLKAIEKASETLCPLYSRMDPHALEVRNMRVLMLDEDLITLRARWEELAWNV